MQSTTAICPSLFNATTAQDGILSRIRLPAGLITSTQCELLATVVNQFGNGEIQITNRANLQIRTSQTLSEEILLDFQDYGLASSTESTDGLRNMMASPTAGIDPLAKINTIPLVKQWNLYLLNHPELEILSNKFSICFDGGETISVNDRPNDICLVAVEISGALYFSLLFKQFVFAAQARARDGEFCHHRNSEGAGASYHGRVHSFNPQPLPSGAHRFPYSIFHNPANFRRRMLAILRGSLF